MRTKLKQDALHAFFTKHHSMTGTPSSQSQSQKNICARVVDQCLEKDTEKDRIGCFFAIQVPEEEVRRWRDSGWYDEP